MAKLIALAAPGPFEMIFLLLLLAVPCAVVLVVLRAGSGRKELPSAFPVLPITEADGPGRYRIVGVDKSSKSDKELIIEAASRANAQVKAELDGVVVTSVAKMV
jgi:hypothetical protein